MKKLIAFFFFSIGYYPLFAQCGIQLTINGTGCLGADTLTVTGSSAINQVKWYLTNNLVSTTNPYSNGGITVAGAISSGIGANQFIGPNGVFVDAAGNIYVADNGNNRVQKWLPGATSGTTVAGGNGGGSGLDQCTTPTNVFVDGLGNVYPAEGYYYSVGGRVLKWAQGAINGLLVAGGNGPGSAADQLIIASGVWVDAAGNIYVTDKGNNRVQKWAPGATIGITVAGGNGRGNGANQLSDPCGIYVDASSNIYIADYSNTGYRNGHRGLHRVLQ